MYLTIGNFLRGPYSLTDTSGKVITYNEGVPHKWLPGDVLLDNKVIERTAERNIVGIIDFFNKTLAGLTSRGVPLYFFYPINASYPPMLVAAKTRGAQNTVAVVSFEHWDDKWPRGGLSKILGPVGNYGVEKTALLSSVSCTSNILVSDDYVHFGNDYERDEWDSVFNIDPAGCADVDDIFFWRCGLDGIVEFGIGIADVSAWIHCGSSEDSFAMRLGQTIYENGTVVTPMLPSVISENKASLRCDGIARPVLALVYRIDNVGGRVLEKSWRRIMIAVKNAYSYENVPAKLLRTVATYLGIATHRGMLEVESHSLVEIAMIHYNASAASVLMSGRNGILRIHSGRSENELQMLAEKSGVSEIAFLGAAAGMYASTSTESTAHSGIGLSAYCHASSPLRRYADLVNQRWLKYLLFPDYASPQAADGALIAHLNMRGQRVKQFERDLYFLQNLRTDSITRVNGVLLTMKDSVNGVVYVPDWKRKIRVGGCTDCAPGKIIQIQVYCDLKAKSLRERVVCSRIAI